MEVSSKDFFKVTCPVCNTQYRISRSKLKKPLQQSVCKRCGANLVFLKRRNQAETSSIYHIGQPYTKSDAEKALRRDRRISIGYFVGVGLLTLIFLTIIFWFIKNSDSYRTAKSFIKNNKEIKGIVGEDMKFGLLPLGSVKESGNTGKAIFKIKVKGPLGSTKVYVTLRKARGQWQVVKALYVAKDGNMKAIAILPRKNQKYQASKGQHLRKAYSFYRKRRYQDAIKEFNEAVKNSPYDPDIYYWRGRAYIFLKRYDNAIDDFEKVIELNPEYVKAYNNLGWLYGIRHEYEKSIDYLSHSIELKPDNGWAYYSRARGYFETGRIKEAKQDLRRACKLGYSKGCDIYKRLTKGR